MMSEQCALGILKATNFAALKHSNQKRKDSAETPYINHPIGVAYAISNEGKVFDLHIIQAALLHDTVEDTNTTFEELELEFGKAVRDLVSEVTDDKSLTKDQRKANQVDHALHISYGAKVVKLSDKLYHLRDITRDPPRGWNVERIQGYFVWGKKVVDNLRGTNAGLEAALDEVFKQNFHYQGKEYPVLPQNVNLDEFLTRYYASMKLLGKEH